uniref:Uncharacterized protein n=1 Tax=Steinernema glaseri TaxID=37863 RepID=A0A1I8AHI7_9BILA
MPTYRWTPSLAKLALLCKAHMLKEENLEDSILSGIGALFTLFSTRPQLQPKALEDVLLIASWFLEPEKLFEKVDKKHEPSSDVEDDRFQDEYLDSEVRDVDIPTPYPSGTPSHHPTKALEREDTALSLHSGSRGSLRKPTEAEKKVYEYESPLKKTNSGPYLNRKVTEAQMATDSFPNSPKKQKTERTPEKTELKDGYSSDGYSSVIKPDFLRQAKDPLNLYKRSASSEEEELKEIYEQQRINKEMLKKKAAADKLEKKAAEKAKTEKKSKDKEKDKDEERKKKKKKKHQTQTVTRDSYQSDSRRDAKSKTKNLMYDVVVVACVLVNVKCGLFMRLEVTGSPCTMFRQLLLLGFLASLGAAEIRRTHQNTQSLIVLIGFYTSTCHGAGTNGDIIPYLGHIDKDDQLIWKLPLRMIDGSYRDNFENGELTSDEVYISNRARIAEIEEACFQHADGDQNKYERCFDPNIVNIQKKSWKYSPLSAWKIEEIKIRVQWGNRHPVANHFGFFGPFHDCYSNWIEKEPEYSYIRTDDKDYSKKAMLKGRIFQIGQKYPRNE